MRGTIISLRISLLIISNLIASLVLFNLLPESLRNQTVVYLIERLNFTTTIDHFNQSYLLFFELFGCFDACVVFLLYKNFEDFSQYMFFIKSCYVATLLRVSR